MSDNPFAVGNYGSSADSSHDPNQNQSMRPLIEALVQTRPWVRLIGILTLIVAGLSLLGGLFIFVAGVQQNGRFAQLGSMVGVMYLAVAVFYIYPGLCLFLYANAISNAETTAQMSSIVEAVVQQKKFWKFLGIFTAIVLGVYAIMFAILILSAVLSAV